jgi:hypothetical protein
MNVQNSRLMGRNKRNCYAVTLVTQNRQKRAKQGNKRNYYL